MKLAEALLTRSEYKKRISELQSRINRNTQVQEGDKPTEDPIELINELTEVYKKLNEIIKRINYVNFNTILEGNISLSDALVDRKLLIEKRHSLLNVATYALPNNRNSRNEIKIISTINVAAMNQEVDNISKQIREIDTKIQAKNWTIDI